MSTSRKWMLGFLAFLLFATVGNLIVGHPANAAVFTVLGVIVAISYFVEKAAERYQAELAMEAFERAQDEAVYNAQRDLSIWHQTLGAHDISVEREEC